MRRCAFLTLAEQGHYVIDDEHAYAPMAELGWQVDPVVWNDPSADWNQYELVVIRSPWDYTQQPQQFMRVLGEIEASKARLENPARIVAWNLQKTYLQDLEARGLVIVPTHFADALAADELPGLFETVGSDQIVIKPQVGATASGAFRLRREELAAQQQEIENYYVRTPLMVQPFLNNVATEGEYSLFYFSGDYSHAILKTPKENDFRSQEEHGGNIQSIEAEDALRAAGQRAVESIGETLLYARADFVRSNDNSEFQLMELELIEPALYFRTDPQSALRFARAVDALMC